MTMHQETPGHEARKPGSVLRAPAVVGSLVLAILVLGASAGAYALTRSPAQGSNLQLPAQGPGAPLVASIQPSTAP